MSRPAWLTESAWEIIRAAKAVAHGEHAAEMLPQHLLQGLAVQEPGLMRGGLAALKLPERELEALFARVSPRPNLPEPPASALPLSSLTNEIVQRRSRALAAEYPAGPDVRVEPVHLWAGLCEAAHALHGWLREREWPEEHIRRLPEVAKTQLPPRQPAPSRLKDSALQVLTKYCRRNLTELARQGRLSPAYGVGGVRQQIVRCLLKKTKRSAVLTGPAGAGKTKLVEDLALAIARGDLPALAGCQIFELDLALFTRGTHLVGSQAERWAELMGVLRSDPHEVILFIDELHTIVGIQMGSQAMDLANALKPLMVDDKVRIIGATTSDEYRRYIEGDPALARRFTEIQVPEPDRDSMLGILNNVAPEFEAHYQVKFSGEALELVYDLAKLYEPNKSFPSKAIDLLDEVGVAVKTAGPKAPASADNPPRVVRPDDVREVLKTRGIEPEVSSIDLAALIKERVIGQDEAADTLADVVITSSFRYGKEDHGGPRGVILFLGPPGVGKSYMAQVLSGILFPGRDSLLTLDMTEFSGPHSGEHARFRLLGPPPPYVGWEQGGLLTRHADRHPVSVVLIDEFEKANAEARNILLRIFHDGWVQDGRGRFASFRNMYFILTANAGQKLWKKVKPIGFEAPQIRPGESGIIPTEVAIRDALRDDGFAPELLSRISNIVLFKELAESELEAIANMKLAGLQDRALIEDFLVVEYDPEQLARWVVHQIAPPRDSRRLAAMFERCVETPLARWRMQHGRGMPPLLRFEPGEKEVKIQIEDSDKSAERAEQLLLQRVDELYGRREGRARKQQTARARLGTAQ